MKTHKVVEIAFEWIPMDRRVSRFGGATSPRKPETRRPLLWLRRDDHDLFLVNSSGEVLESVEASSGGFATVEDDVDTVASSQPYDYQNVQPGAAVKVDEYDDFYDLDYVIQVVVTVRSKGLGCLEIFAPSEKGGLVEAVLLWDTGESGKHVGIKRT